MTYEPEKPKRGLDDDLEYVGAPTEFADVEEVPEWVENIAKVLFFLPSAFLTMSALPFVLLAIVVVCCACLAMFSAALGGL